MEDRENMKMAEPLPEAGCTAQKCATPAPRWADPFYGQGIGWAIKQLYHGLKVRRRGWNGRGMWLALQTPDLHSKMTLPYVYMRTAQGDLVPWLCSQTDLLAMDWEIATAD